MKATDSFKTGNKIFSFEFFPPKTPEDTRRLYAAVQELVPLHPAFISVTSSSTGIAAYRTVALSGLIKHRTGVETVAHLTCIAHTRREISAIAGKLHETGVENILALRGDMPESHGLKHRSDYIHAADLVRHLRELGEFCIGVAGYPEGHSESPSRQKDIEWLKFKTDAGADFVITQLFFDNSLYFRFIDDCRRAGISIPVIPGIMPVTSYPQLRRFTEMCGASIPPGMIRDLERIKNDPSAVEDYGREHALRQCRELLERGAPGIHFYTLNRSASTRKILSQLR
ncbi:MAG: methylenetetrahydrofolate reductase [NAD(P)H] [bacterium]